MLPTIVLAGTVLAFLVFTLRRKPRLPPGPAGYPIVGNLFQFPKQTAWLTLAEWAKQYGIALKVRQRVHEQYHFRRHYAYFSTREVYRSPGFT